MNKGVVRRVLSAMSAQHEVPEDAQTTETEKPSLAIVILNWNNYEDTARCIESLERVPYPNLDIVVVDNGSNDGSGRELKDEYGFCKFIFNDENRGFAGGVNAAIESYAESCDYILLLNNDMVFQKGSLDLLISTIDSSPDTGIVSPKTVYMDREAIQTAGRRFNRFKIRFENLHHGLHPDQLSGVMKADAVSGGCMLIDTEMIEEVGVLNDNFFFGGEDVEYCMRAKQNDWQIKIQADASVKHKPHSSTGSGDKFTRYHYTRNRLMLGLQAGLAGKVGIIRKCVNDLTRIFGLSVLGRKEEASAILLAYYDLLSRSPKKRTNLI